MVRAPWIDTGQRVGPSPAHDVISGESKVRKESVIAFARRHGWAVEEYDDPDGYLIDVFLTKFGREEVQVALWPGRTKQLALATINRIQLPQHSAFPTRERVEMYLAGIDCTCTPDPDLYPYEQKQEPSCPIHGEGS